MVPVTCELTDNLPELCGCCFERFHDSLRLHFCLLQIFPFQIQKINSSAYGSVADPNPGSGPFLTLRIRDPIA
jgi:hypothetical protein